MPEKKRRKVATDPTKDSGPLPVADVQSDKGSEPFDWSASLSDWQINQTVPAKTHNIVALDVEMVKLIPKDGSKPRENVAAIVSLVDGQHKYLDCVKVRREPGTFVVDHWTRSISGVPNQNFLRDGMPLKDIQEKIREHKNKLILVCGDEGNDIGSLGLSLHEFKVCNIQTLFLRPDNRVEPIALRTLAKHYLGREIQGKRHNPTEDAQATFDLYHDCYLKSDDCFGSVDEDAFRLDN